MNMKKLHLFIGSMALILALPLRAQDPFESYGRLVSMEKSSLFRELEWKQVGPVFQGGRIETLDSPPDQPNVIYAGFGSGSLWKSSDQGLSWTCIFHDRETFSIGDLAIAPSNPDVVYLGTGENLRATRGFTFPGTGVYKSVDAGKSWTNIGLHDTHHIGRVVVDPNNSNLVFVAAMGHMWSRNGERGLFITKDGGTTWNRALFVSDSTGVVDVVWDPVNQVLLAAAWQMVQGRQSGIYRSVDLGQHWEKCRDGFPENEGIGRIGLAMSTQNPSIVYACLDNRNSDPSNRETGLTGLEVYRSSDSGKTWKKVNQVGLDNYSGFGWAFGDIRVSPLDPDEIYVLGIHVLHSRDGGKTYSRLSGNISHLVPSRADSLHLDQHELYIDPSNPDRMILGNDGGVYLSCDKGHNWLHCNNIPAAEIYDMSIGNADGTVVYAGTQDNASVYGQVRLNRPLSGDTLWHYVWLDPWSGGDGFVTVQDPGDPESVYYESQNGYLNRKNMADGTSKFIQPKPEPGEAPLRTNWLTPYFFSHHSRTTIYYGANKVYKSIDRGDNWYRISPDLSFSDDPQRKSRTTTALAESPVKAGLLYAGTDHGAVWISRNDGVNWIEISKGLATLPVIQICPSMHEESRIYLVMKPTEEDDYHPYVYVSEKKGVSWKRIDGGLPVERANCVLEDPELPDLIYLGTDRGVLVSPDRGNSWISLGNGLTTASVQKLLWAEDGEYLLAATHGQSIFACYASPIRKYFKSADPGKESILGRETGYLPGQKDFPGDLLWNRWMPAALYWYQPREGSMSVAVIDPDDNHVFTGRINGIAGMNVWKWDMLLERKEDNGLYPVAQYKFPAPGTYKVTIQGQGMIIRSDLEIR
jgi:photosystem II stability/assembly factor-like uncharacterized protein